MREHAVRDEPSTTCGGEMWVRGARPCRASGRERRVTWRAARAACAACGAGRAARRGWSGGSLTETTLGEVRQILADGEDATGRDFLLSTSNNELRVWDVSALCTSQERGEAALEAPREGVGGHDADLALRHAGARDPLLFFPHPPGPVHLLLPLRPQPGPAPDDCGQPGHLGFLCSPFPLIDSRCATGLRLSELGRPATVPTRTANSVSDLSLMYLISFIKLAASGIWTCEHQWCLRSFVALKRRRRRTLTRVVKRAPGTPPRLPRPSGDHDLASETRPKHALHASAPRTQGFLEPGPVSLGSPSSPLRGSLRPLDLWRPPSRYAQSAMAANLQCSSRGPRKLCGDASGQAAREAALKVAVGTDPCRTGVRDL